jgi:hypothetical protein
MVYLKMENINNMMDTKINRIYKNYFTWQPGYFEIVSYDFHVYRYVHKRSENNTWYWDYFLK